MLINTRHTETFRARMHGTQLQVQAVTSCMLFTYLYNVHDIVLENKYYNDYWHVLRNYVINIL